MGTNCNKALLVDINGVPVASSIDYFEIKYPKLKYAEQDPDDWWRSICKTT